MGDENAGRALFGGAVAALVGALIWTAVVKLTNYEVGWVAWGIGALVGLTMAKMTPARSGTLGVYAALLAALGLATGKVMQLKATASSAHQEIVADQEALTHAFLLDMRTGESFSPEVNAELAQLGPRDTVPDLLWGSMMAEARQRMDGAPPQERERVARAMVTQIVGGMSITEQFMATLSLFDALWFFLALGTAWKFMKGD
ncbi:MAG TPA: hypothetical protein VNI61_09935 [Gemmatimonadales bacterium]|nr:hypothetical protein [Gemmatimonadales bacterium]